MLALYLITRKRVNTWQTHYYELGVFKKLGSSVVTDLRCPPFIYRQSIKHYHITCKTSSMISTLTFQIYFQVNLAILVHNYLIFLHCQQTLFFIVLDSFFIISQLFLIVLDSFFITSQIFLLSWIPSSLPVKSLLSWIHSSLPAKSSLLSLIPSSLPAKSSLLLGFLHCQLNLCYCLGLLNLSSISFSIFSACADRTSGFIDKK